MQSSKLTQLHVYIIGAVVAFVLGLGLFFILINPEMQKLTELKTREQTADSTLQTTPDQAVQQATQEKAAAQQDAAVKEANWNARIRAQSPPPSLAIPVGTFENRLRSMSRWWRLPQAIRQETERFARGMPGVEVNTYFGTLPRNPDPDAIPKDILIYRLGPMTARGSFPNVMRWARRWNSYRYNPLVDGLQLQMVDKGQVLARADLTLHIWTPNKPTAGAAPAAPGMDPSMMAPGGSGMPPDPGPGMPTPMPGGP
jgi:hypothetical protein